MSQRLTNFIMNFRMKTGDARPTAFEAYGDIPLKVPVMLVLILVWRYRYWVVSHVWATVYVYVQSYTSATQGHCKCTWHTMI